MQLHAMQCNCTLSHLQAASEATLQDMDGMRLVYRGPEHGQEEATGVQRFTALRRISKAFAPSVQERTNCFH